MTENSASQETSGDSPTGNPAPGRTVLVAAVAVAVVTGTTLFWFFRDASSPVVDSSTESSSKTEFSLSRFQDPEIDYPTPPAPGYVGPQACTECHTERAKEFMQTNHYRTSRRPRPGEMPGGFQPGQGEFKTRHPDIRFEMSRHGDDFVQSALRTTADSEEHTTASIDLVYGAGDTDDVYFHWDEQDRFFELQVGWLWTSDQWGVTSFDKFGKGHFGRPMTVRCLECHNTWFHHVPGTLSQYRRENVIIGVTCERCHGPGKKHVDYHHDHPEEEISHDILHPGQLSRDRKLDLCLQCHSNSEKHLGPAFSYRPGKPLAEFYKTEKIDRHEDDRVANQIDYLRQSKCFQKSEMTCLTCHDPHTKQATTTSRNDSCLQCHKPQHCKEREKLPDAVRSNCIGCHMPKFVKINVNFDIKDELFVPPVRRSQHKIAAHPAARDKVLLKWYREQDDEPSQKAAEELMKSLLDHYDEQTEQHLKDYRFVAAVASVREALHLEPPAKDRERLTKIRNSAAATQARVIDLWAESTGQIGRNELDAAIKTFEAILSINPQDAEANGRLGTLLFRKGEKQRATDYLRKVVEYDPGDAYGITMIGWQAFLDGRTAEALKNFELADEIDPYRAKIQYFLGLTFASTGKFKLAEDRLRRALKIDPRHIPAAQELTKVLLQRGASKEALRYARRVAHLLEYKDLNSLITLAEVCDQAGNSNDAIAAAAMALKQAKQNKAGARILAQIKQRMNELLTKLPADKR